MNRRLQQAMGSLFHIGYVTARTDILHRTDVEAPIPNRKQKHALHGRQEGKCTACKFDIQFKIIEADHAVPRSREGSNDPDSLQLLCPNCNRIKGDRDMAYPVARLGEG